METKNIYEKVLTDNATKNVIEYYGLSTDDLPDDAETGDLYTVGTAQYVFDGSQWIEIGGSITDQQIDNLFTEV